MCWFFIPYQKKVKGFLNELDGGSFDLWNVRSKSHKTSKIFSYLLYLYYTTYLVSVNRFSVLLLLYKIMGYFVGSNNLLKGLSLED